MEYRLADLSDVALLAQANSRLIVDEGYRQALSLADLEARWEDWLNSAYRAVIFEEAGSLVAYALYSFKEDGVYLRQFFVERGSRRRGAGREAFSLLRDEIWRPGIRVTVDALVHNEGAAEFWRSLGFRDYAITFELDDERPEAASAAD